MLTDQQVNDLSARTQDAYSAPTYGERNWKMIIRWLSKKGYDAQAIEAIIRSKYMRWAYDMSAATLPGFKIFYDKCVTDYDKRGDARNEYFTPRAIDQLIDGTFPPKNKAEAEARQKAREERDLKAHMARFAEMQYRARQRWCQENGKAMPKAWQDEYNNREI
jgi:hypothetical protein